MKLEPGDRVVMNDKYHVSPANKDMMLINVYTLNIVTYMQGGTGELKRL